MTDVVGLPLEIAKSRLEHGKATVKTREIRSRKGLDGTDLRVVQQKMNEDGSVLLTVSAFKTDVPNDWKVFRDADAAPHTLHP